MNKKAIVWTNDGLVYWRMYASIGLDELILLINECVSENQILYWNRECIWNSH